MIMTLEILIFLITALRIAGGVPTDIINENDLRPMEEEETTSSILTKLTNNNNNNNNLLLKKSEEELISEFENDVKIDNKKKIEIEPWISQRSINNQLKINPDTSATVKTESNIKLKNDSIKERKTKKGKKHKALFIDYPFVPQISAIPNYEPYDNNLHGNEEKIRGGGGGGGGGGGSKKRYHESNIYYIRLPPTPYMFVPGIGYVSQPPTYSTGPLRPQIPHVRPQVNPYRPSHNVYNSPASLNDINPFINLPIDFVSNGKPTAVYQWPSQSNSYQSNKRGESRITTLDKGPYFFNGRPHSIYLLRPADDHRPPVRQTIQYSDYQDNSYY